VAILDELRLAVAELDERRALALVPVLLAQGASPLSILNSCQQALRVVGERYERQEYYISGLIMAGELFNEVLDLVQPLYKESPLRETAGTIVLGTVARDIHDIGKNLFATTLRGFDFNVIDLGVDVTPETFLVEVARSQPDVVCLSGLILAAFESMKQTVALLRTSEADLHYHPPIILGGGTVDGRVCDYCGADSWSTDAMEGVRICQDLLARARLH
jgi:methanogenic corrinoid protein MtbC1